MTDLPEPDLGEAAEVVVANLVAHFAGVDEAEIRELVIGAIERIASGTKAPAFVGVLAEKEVRDVLAARNTASDS